MAGSGLILEELWGSRQPGGASPCCLAQWAVSSHCGKLRQRRQGAVGVNALLLPISHPNPEYRPQAMSWPKPPSLSHAKDLRTSKELLLGQHRVTQLPAMEPWFQKLSAKDCLDYRHIKPSDDVLPPSPAHIASLLVIYMVLAD